MHLGRLRRLLPSEKKPLWELLANFETEQIVRSIDFSYITYAITPGEALALLKQRASSKETRLATKEGRGSTRDGAGNVILVFMQNS